MESMNWNGHIVIDEYIEKSDFSSTKRTQELANLSGVADIQIVVENQDENMLPSKSYMYAEGSFRFKDNNRFKDNILNKTIIYNGIMYLFSRVSYKNSIQEVAGDSHLGVATTMTSLLIHPPECPEGINSLSLDSNYKIADN